MSNQYQVEIIGVLEEPHKSENEEILVTPTLIKLLLPPLQRIIGDLSNGEKVLYGLDLISSN